MTVNTILRMILENAPNQQISILAFMVFMKMTDNGVQDESPVVYHGKPQ